MLCKSKLKRRHSATRNTTIADSTSWPHRSRGESKVLISKRELETRTDLHWELRAKVKPREKANKMPQTSPGEETACVGSRKDNVHLKIRAHSSMNQTRKAKNRDDFVHLLRQVHLTEVRKAVEKEGTTEAQQAHQNSLVKVRQEKQTGFPLKFQERKLPKGKREQLAASRRVAR